MNTNYPIIRRRIRGVELARAARGFSKTELIEAKFSSITFARKKGIPVDELRKTTVPENVEKLKSLTNKILNAKRNESKSTKEKDEKISAVGDNKPNEAIINKEND